MYTCAWFLLSGSFVQLPVGEWYTNSKLERLLFPDGFYSHNEVDLIFIITCKNGGAPYAAAQSPVRSYGGQLRAPAATLRLRLLEVISSLPTAGMESSYAALLR